MQRNQPQLILTESFSSIPPNRDLGLSTLTEGYLEYFPNSLGTQHIQFHFGGVICVSL